MDGAEVRNPKPISTVAPPQNNKQQRQRRKRKQKEDEDDDVQSPYFKLRALVLHLRPSFIQILRTPEFRDCNASAEIRSMMKLVMDFYKQMQMKGNKRGKGEKAVRVMEETTEKKLSDPHISFENKCKDGRLQGSYVVGGSVYGLNFITFTNRIPSVYYGETKESYRSRLCKS